MIRAQEAILKNGDIKFLDFNKEILVYERILDNEKIIIIINIMEKEESISLFNINNNVVNLIDKNERFYIEENQLNITLKAQEFKLLKIL